MKKIQFREAKITPKKIGQFVTFWQRDLVTGKIKPFDFSDDFDLLVVSVSDKKEVGHFIFPKEILLKENIISKNGKGGKRAMRVYPLWDKADNKQAIATQKWQLRCFVEGPLEEAVALYPLGRDKACEGGVSVL